MHLSGILDFYATLSMKTYSQQYPGDMRAHDKFVMDVSVYLDRISDHIALCFRDYLWLIALGEARHAGGYCKSLCPSIPWVSSRGAAYSVLTRFPPVPENIAIVEEIFKLPDWGSSCSIGGRRWANIAKAVSNYTSYPASIYVDNVSSIVHNGGLAFNKGEAENHLDISLDIGMSVMQRILEAAKHNACFAADFPSSQYDISDYTRPSDYIRLGTLLLLRRFSNLYDKSPWPQISDPRSNDELLYKPCQWRDKRLLSLVPNLKHGVRDHIEDFEDHTCIWCNCENANCKLINGAYSCDACATTHKLTQCVCGIYIDNTGSHCSLCQCILHDNCSSTGNKLYCKNCNRTVCGDCMIKCRYCGKSMCNECAKNTYTTCEQCGKAFCGAEYCSSLLTESYCGKMICRTCANKHIEHCDTCVGHFCNRCHTFYDDELVTCESCGSYVCDNCSDTCECCNHLYCTYCSDMAYCGDCNSNFCHHCADESLYYIQGKYERFCLDCATRRVKDAGDTYKLCKSCHTCYTDHFCSVCDKAICANCSSWNITCNSCGKFMCSDCASSHSFHKCGQCGRVLCDDCKPHFASKCGLLFCSPACIKAHYAGGCERELSKDVPLCDKCKQRHIIGHCKICGTASNLCQKCSDAQSKYTGAAERCCICNAGMCSTCKNHPSVWKMKHKSTGRIYAFCGENCVLAYYKKFSDTIRSDYALVYRVEDGTTIYHQQKIVESQVALESSVVSEPVASEPPKVAPVAKPVAPIVLPKSKSAFDLYVKAIKESS